MFCDTERIGVFSEQRMVGIKERNLPEYYQTPTREWLEDIRM
jgi:hypothetical protein